MKVWFGEDGPGAEAIAEHPWPRGQRVRGYVRLPLKYEDAAIRAVHVPPGRPNFCVVVDDGWDGSFHDPHYWGGAGVFICYTGPKREGWIGRLRRLAREIMAAEHQRKRARAQMRYTILRTGLIRRGIWREEGD